MQQLRLFREAWRMSRTTFFDLTHGNHEALRCEVDEVYYASLALLLKLMVEFDDDETVAAQMLDALGIAVTSANAKALNQSIQQVVDAGGEDPVLKTRILTERIPAVLMARTETLTDTALCARLGKNAATPQGRPLIRLARMARSVPQVQSCLWLLWVNQWLYPKVYPGGRDPYSVVAVTSEFAIFANDPMFWKLLQRPTDLERRLLDAEPIRKFLSALQRLEDDDEVNAYVGAHLQFIETTVHPLLTQELAQGYSAVDVAAVRRATKADVAWTVPGFYLCISQRMPEQQARSTQGLSAAEGNLTPFIQRLSQLSGSATG